MHPELADAIRLFRHDQDLALDYLHDKLRIPVPTTASEWATSSYPYVAAVKPLASEDGVTLYHHGYGIEVTHPDFHIDFDYGPLGQCDCFDTWRLSLHRHLRLRLRGAVDDPRPLNEWLQDAVASGELVQMDPFAPQYCQPGLRSRWTPVPQGGK